MLYRHVFGRIFNEFCSITRFFVNFAGFRGYTRISRLRDRAKYQKPCLSEIHRIKDAGAAIFSPILIISFTLKDKRLHPSSMQAVRHINLSLSCRATELVIGRS